MPPSYLTNPYLEPARRIWATTCGPRPLVARGPEVVADDDYIPSPFYAEWGRGLGMRYEIGTTLLSDATTVAALGAYRSEGVEPFGDAERVLLLALDPHMRRALQLRRRLLPDPRRAQ